MMAGMAGAHPGGWLVTAISADGKHRLLPIEIQGRLTGWEGEDLGKNQHALFGRGTEYASDKFDGFGWRGDIRGKKETDRVGLEAAYKWDAAKKKYTVTWKHVPVARPNKAKKK